MNDMMTFPDTWEEYEKMYGFNDEEEVYTNGARLIPSFRVKQWLDHMPTVNQWIPVSERLPEEDDYRPCYGHDDGVVWWVNDMGIIGLGWYYNSTGQWAYYDEITHSEQSVGKVLAWMPLPPAYKGDK